MLQQSSIEKKNFHGAIFPFLSDRHWEKFDIGEGFKQCHFANGLLSEWPVTASRR